MLVNSVFLPVSFCQYNETSQHNLAGKIKGQHYQSRVCFLNTGWE